MEGKDVYMFGFKLHEVSKVHHPEIHEIQEIQETKKQKTDIMDLVLNDVIGYKESDGELSFKAEQLKKALLLEITENEIGFKPSEEIKKMHIEIRTKLLFAKSDKEVEDAVELYNKRKTEIMQKNAAEITRTQIEHTEKKPIIQSNLHSTPKEFEEIKEITEVKIAAEPQNQSNVKKYTEEQIAQEAAERTKAEAKAKLKAEQAQKFYSSLSNTVTGKSARESADFFTQIHDEQIAEEAAERTKMEAKAAVFKRKAQRYYTSLSDKTCEKSAAKSAEVFIHDEQITKEAHARIKAEADAKLKAEQAQKYYSSLSDCTTGKSAQESAKILSKIPENALSPQEEKITENIAETAKNSKALNKLKSIFLNNKGKTGAAIIAGLIIGYRQLKNKNDNNKKSD